MMYIPIDPSKIEFIQISKNVTIARHNIVGIRAYNEHQDPSHHFLRVYVMTPTGLSSIDTEYGATDVPSVVRKQLGVEFT